MSLNEIEYLRDRILLLEQIVETQGQLIAIQKELLEPTPDTLSNGFTPRFPFPRD